MNRCIGYNKYNKRCRTRIESTRFFCCESHEPINKEILSEPCIMCSQNVTPDEITILKCNHAFHKKCLNEFFSYTQTESCLLCPMCRHEINTPSEKKDKKILTFSDKYYIIPNDVCKILKIGNTFENE